MAEETHRRFVTGEGSLRTALEQHEQVVVAFRAGWSDRCRQLERKLDAEEESELLVVDVDAYPMLAYRHDVNRIPTLLRFEKGEVVDRWEGVPDDVGQFLHAEFAH